MSTITVELDRYIGLLIRSNCTDPAEWPPEAREGAALLAAIRAAEQACREAHGQWDWELLSAEEQLDYDSACARLDALRRRFDPRPNIPLGQYLAERGIELE